MEGKWFSDEDYENDVDDDNGDDDDGGNDGGGDVGGGGSGGGGGVGSDDVCIWLFGDIFVFIFEGYNLIRLMHIYAPV